MNRPVLIFGLIMHLFIGCNTFEQRELDLNNHPPRVEIFGESLISTGLYERDLAISSSGDEIIFTRGDYKQLKRCLVLLSRKQDRWAAPQILSFSGRYNDIEPFFSPDGQQLFFASDRPIQSDTTRKDYNLWVASRGDGQWLDPKPLGKHINTEGDEFYPSVSKIGNLYFTASYEDGPGREDIYRSTLINGIFQKPVPLDSAVNTLAYEFNAYVSPDEDFLLFSSYGRPDGLGGGDLYFSKKKEDGSWQKAVNMGPRINSDRLDYSPFVDFKGGNLYFTSERFEAPGELIQSVEALNREANKTLNGMGNIYRIALNELELF